LVALLAKFSNLSPLGIGPGLNPLTDFFTNAVAIGLKAAATLLEVALLLCNQLEACEINIHPPTSQLTGNQFGVITHQALVKHGNSEEGRLKSLRLGSELTIKVLRELVQPSQRQQPRTT
jgi:hypothetical protein